MFQPTLVMGTVVQVANNSMPHTVKVSWHGYHNVGPDPIAIDDLPDSHCIMNNSPSLNGYGESINYHPQSTVIGMHIEGEGGEDKFFIIGSLHKGAVPQYG
jgi:hypothetical protein